METALFYTIELDYRILWNLNKERKIHEQDNTIGYIGLTKDTDEKYSLEYYIFRKYRGYGFGTEAVDLLIKNAFEGKLREISDIHAKTLPVDEIRVSIKSNDEISKKLLKKLGFAYEEGAEYIPLCFADYALEHPIKMQDYWMTAQHFQELFTQRKKVYAVMYAFYSDWILYGYFSAGE